MELEQEKEVERERERLHLESKKQTKKVTFALLNHTQIERKNKSIS